MLFKEVELHVTEDMPLIYVHLAPPKLDPDTCVWGYFLGREEELF